jgi:hypothetical protein
MLGGVFIVYLCAALISGFAYLNSNDWIVYNSRHIVPRNIPISTMLALKVIIATTVSVLPNDVKGNLREGFIQITISPFT